MINRQNKDFTFNDEARDKVLEGARVVFEAVKQSYGPTSGNVGIEKLFGAPVQTHDGVTVARDIFLKDSPANIGAQWIKMASLQTNQVAGDGTSGTVVLAYHIIEKARRAVTSGSNAMRLSREILAMADQVKDAVVQLSEEVSDEKLKDVATISAGDPALGALIAETILEVGDNGGVTVEEYAGLGTESEIVEGYYFDKGYHAPVLATDPQTMSAVYEDCYVLAVEDKIASSSDMFAILNKLLEIEKGAKLLLIGDVIGDALNYEIENKIRQGIKVVSVPAPIYGGERANYLEDIAISTGGQMLVKGQNPDSITPSEFQDYLGKASKVVVTADSTTIIGGAGDNDKVKERISALEALAEKDTNAYRKDRLTDRLAKLTGKIGVIRVGGATEIEMREAKFRVDDAVHATRASRAEGVVPGGSTTLALIYKKFDKPTEGGKIVLEACQELFKQLIENAGDDGAYYLKLLKDEPIGNGFDLKNLGPVVDLKEAGIVDPTKVVKTIVENACSVASQSITTNCLITFDKDFEVPGE